MSHHKSMRPRQGADSKSLDAPYDQVPRKADENSREFWIMLHGNGLHSEEALLYYQEPCEPMKSLAMHVIEKSAYDQATALIEDLKKEQYQFMTGVQNFKCQACGHYVSPHMPVNLINEIDALKSALNKIAMLGHGELAYTSEFTEAVMQIAHKALTGRDRGL